MVYTLQTTTESLPYEIGNKNCHKNHENENRKRCMICKKWFAISKKWFSRFYVTFWEEVSICVLGFMKEKRFSQIQN